MNGRYAPECGRRRNAMDAPGLAINADETMAGIVARQLGEYLER